MVSADAKPTVESNTWIQSHPVTSVTSEWDTLPLKTKTWKHQMTRPKTQLFNIIPSSLGFLYEIVCNVVLWQPWRMNQPPWGTDFGKQATHHSSASPCQLSSSCDSRPAMCWTLRQTLARPLVNSRVMMFLLLCLWILRNWESQLKRICPLLNPEVFCFFLKLP